MKDPIAEWYESKRRAGSAAWAKVEEHRKLEPAEKYSPAWYEWSMQRAKLTDKAIDAGDCGD